MIQLTRERTSKAVPAAYRDPKRLEHELKLLKLRASGGKPDAGHWKAAKRQLRKESGGKCAYCEGPSDMVAHGDVEHFRPKSVYWWLAYCYDNYLYACQICNQVQKGDAFPVRGKRLKGPEVVAGMAAAAMKNLLGSFAPDPVTDNAAYTRQEFEKTVNAEKADLPHPYAEDPERLFRWVVDENLKEVSAAARSRSAAGRRRFEAAERLFGLNREELLRWRWERYKDLKALKEIIDALAGRTDGRSREAGQIAEARLIEMMARTAPFAAMARYFIQVEWGMPLRLG